jgi:uncharacterized protein (TIGR03435 family)
MNFPTTIMFAFALMSALSLPAQEKPDITGNWQGTLQAGQALRTIVQVTRTDKGYAGKFFSIDQGGQAPLTTVTLEGSTFKYTLDQASLSYVGTLSADGNTITGTSTQGGKDLPLTFLRATKETAWEIPAPPPPVKRMAADANPSFDVATIKPSDPDKPNQHFLVIRGRNFATSNYTLGELISFAYQVQAKQVVGGPDWMSKDKYDITAVPVEEGAPDTKQLRTMIRKLLAERWKLKFHDDKRELPAYALTVVKTGSKLKETESKGPLPGLFFRPAPNGLGLGVQNATIGDLAGLLQEVVLDRPVVDQTGLTAKYDFVMAFTPDDSEFNGHPPPVQKKEGVEAAPSLFDALQQSLGLKLEAQKMMVPVIAIDHVEKPSGN